MTGFKPLSKHFSRQKSSAHFGEKREKGVSIRKPTSGLTVSKASGRQYCMQSIPLAVLKHQPSKGLLKTLYNCMQSIPLAVLKLAQSEVVGTTHRDCMQSIPLAVLKPCSFDQILSKTKNCMQSIPLAVLKPHHPGWLTSDSTLHAIHTACGIETDLCSLLGACPMIACNPYRLRY